MSFEYEGVKLEFNHKAKEYQLKRQIQDKENEIAALNGIIQEQALKIKDYEEQLKRKSYYKARPRLTKEEKVKKIKAEKISAKLKASWAKKKAECNPISS